MLTAVQMRLVVKTMMDNLRISSNIKGQYIERLSCDKANYAENMRLDS